MGNGSAPWGLRFGGNGIHSAAAAAMVVVAICSIVVRRFLLFVVFNSSVALRAGLNTNGVGIKTQNKSQTTSITSK